MNREFFLTWLKLGCIVVSITGLVSFAASSETFGELWLWLFDLVKWPLDGDPASFSSDTRSLNAILGGVMVGWEMLMYFVAAGPVAEGDVKLARQMLISVFVWFCIDSTGSYLSQLPGNILLNLIFLVMLAVPLLALSKGTATVESSVESR
ncbi:MAG: hypothetical protein ACFE0J_06590 [Elainellaceae cyanobacterium]